MDNITFRAIVVEETADGKFKKSVKIRNTSDLPAGEVLVKVKYSTLNYKDALSASGNKGITKKYPHTPGIDSAGVVVSSGNSLFKRGEEVIVTGYDLGMNTPGGLSEYVSVPASWVVLPPAGLTLREAMIIGTAGFTAAIGINEIIRLGTPKDKAPVVVSGATGGVGSMAVAMLSKAGYRVAASTGKAERADYLKSIGAAEVISRTELNDTSAKGLLSKRWIAGIDTVGGTTLSTMLRAIWDRGIVANCGMIDSTLLNVPIFPFIIRGVRLVGIAAADTPMKERLEIWDLISDTLKPDRLELMAREIALDDVPAELDNMLAGRSFAKALVNMEK